MNKLSKEELGGMLSTGNDIYETPQAFFDKLHKEFDFTLDAACNKQNAKCPRFFTEEDDGLTQDWENADGTPASVWLNPPYSNNEAWIKKIIEEIGKKAEVVVVLIPSRTSTYYFNDLILPNVDEIRFVKGRLKFGDSKSSAPFPSMVCIFRKNRKYNHIHVSSIERQ